MKLSAKDIEDVEELLLLAKAGDEEARAEVMERYKHLVLSKARQFFLRGGDREDLIQEGMIGLYKAICDYTPGKSGFYAFASLCVERRLFTAVKRDMREKNRPLNDSLSLDADEENERFSRIASPEHNPEEEYIRSESIRRTLQRVLELLSPLETEVLTRLLAGKKYEEIARELNTDVKACDNAMQRIKAKIRKANAGGEE